MSSRQEFVALACAQGANVSALCRRFGVSRKTAYKWIGRHRAGLGLEDRSRRPGSSPNRSPGPVESLVLRLRDEHPAWGARKLKRRLEDLGHAMPARSAVHRVLVRGGRIDPAAGAGKTPLVRFERASPNELWQMDYKGHFALVSGRCHPLTVLDDHSRYNLVLRACSDQREATVKAALADAMRRYGMPGAILADNGPPWGSYGQDGNWTKLGVWLLRLGIRLTHGRPGHPQTQGKEERFHRTLAVEAIGTRQFPGVADAQAAFDAWREVYNHRRPHDALDLATPATRYAPSPRSFTEHPAPVEYGPGDQVRRVGTDGRIGYRGKGVHVGKAFAGEPVAIRPTTADGVMAVYYAHQPIRELDLRLPEGG